MGFLKNIFKSKPGGTAVGNLLRAGSSLAAATGVVPGAGLIAKLLPAAPPALVQQAQEIVANVIAAPVAASPVLVATDVKNDLIAAGATAEQAALVGSVAHAAASLEPVQAQQALTTASAQLVGVQSNFLDNGDVKKVLNGAVDGLKNGIVDGVMQTDAGKAMKAEALNTEGAKIMPWLLGVAIGVIGYLAVKKK